MDKKEKIISEAEFYLQEILEFPVNVNREANVYIFDYKTDEFLWNIFVHVNTDVECVTINCLMNNPVPEGSREKMLGFVNECNSRIMIGAFSIQLDNGDFLYRITQKLFDELSVIKMLDDTLRLSAKFITDYSKGIQCLLDSDAMDTAFEKIEEYQKSYDIFEL